MFDELDLHQSTNFPTCGKNILDVALSKHMALTTSVEHPFMTIYDLSNHFPVAVDIDFTLFLDKPVFDSFYSFGVQTTMK